MPTRSCFLFLYGILIVVTKGKAHNESRPLGRTLQTTSSLIYTIADHRAQSRLSLFLGPPPTANQH